MSKKMAIISVLVVAFVLILAGSAFAADWVHGNYSATTDACAGCHVAHAATLPKLLKSGATQTHFCYLCHGTGGPGAPYDAQMGQIVHSTTHPSTAGGFERTGGPAGDVITSRHKVWGYATNIAALDPADTASRLHVPGGTSPLTSGLVCGSCHDPHAGGTLTVDVDGVMTAGSINPRLLRTKLPAGNNLQVRFKIEDMGAWAHSDAHVYRVVGYVSGSNGWCGGCHDKFDVGVGFGGSDGVVRPMYRHAMGVPADLTGLAGRNYTNLETAGTPTEGTVPGDGEVACLTCHRAHSTTAAAAGWATNWSSDGGTGLGSALLRMDNRGVCWSCHDAATANTPGWWLLP